MSVVSADEIHDGRGGGITLSLDGKMVRQYTRNWRVVTSNNHDNAATILSDYRFPLVGVTYPNDIFAFCRSIVPRNTAKSKRVWIVTATYSTERQIVENPLADPAEIEWDTVDRTRPFFKDKDGLAILNAAGFYFDPPVEDDDSRWVATVVGNVPAVPSWLGAYRNAINTDAFTLDGYSVGVRMAKMAAIRIGKWQERNHIQYRVLTMKIGLNEDTWIKETLNDGFYELASGGADPTHIEDTNGDKVTMPWPLDSDGKMIAKPTPANATFISSSTAKEKAFSSLPLT